MFSLDGQRACTGIVVTTSDFTTETLYAVFRLYAVHSPEPCLAVDP